MHIPQTGPAVHHSSVSPAGDRSPCRLSSASTTCGTEDGRGWLADHLKLCLPRNISSHVIAIKREDPPPIQEQAQSLVGSKMEEDDRRVVPDFGPHTSSSSEVMTMKREDPPRTRPPAEPKGEHAQQLIQKGEVPLLAFETDKGNPSVSKRDKSGKTDCTIA